MRLYFKKTLTIFCVTSGQMSFCEKNFPPPFECFCVFIYFIFWQIKSFSNMIAHKFWSIRYFRPFALSILSGSSVVVQKSFSTGFLDFGLFLPKSKENCRPGGWFNEAELALPASSPTTRNEELKSASSEVFKWWKWAPTSININNKTTR